MTKYDYVWLWMTMHDLVWLCITIYDYVFIFMTMYAYVWLFVTLYDYVWWHCMIVYDYERERGGGRAIVQQFKLFHIVPKLFIFFQQTLTLSIFVYLCLPLFTFVYLCSNDASVHKFCACLYLESIYICVYSDLILDLLLIKVLISWYNFISAHLLIQLWICWSLIRSLIFLFYITEHVKQ